jgi:hypothetical protein
MIASLIDPVVLEGIEVLQSIRQSSFLAICHRDIQGPSPGIRGIGRDERCPEVPDTSGRPVDR